jgi:thioredoxin 1
MEEQYTKTGRIWHNDVFGGIMSEGVKLIEESNFKKEIEKGVVLVDFTASWCGPCRMLAPVLEKVAQEIKPKATIAKLDIDQAQKTASDYQVTSVPTMILFKNGDEVGRLVGLRDAETIKDFISSMAVS